MVWDANALDTHHEHTETLSAPVSSKELVIPGRMCETVGSEDGGSPSSNRQLKRCKMLLMVGPKTPQTLVSASARQSSK